MAFEDLEQHEEVNIGDDGADTESNAQSPDNGSDPDTGTDPNEPEDRGDVFIDPEEEQPGDEVPVDGGDKLGDVAEGSGDQVAAEVGDGKGEASQGEVQDTDGSGDGKIPASRLGEVSRVKSAATAVGDGLVEGTIDAAVVRDFGGVAAVAKAIANKELTIEDLQTGALPQQQAKHDDRDDPNNPANWDLDAKYQEYSELLVDDKVAEASKLLRQITKEERSRDRAEEAKVSQHQKVVSFVGQLVQDYPVLNDTTSPEHESVMVWANHFQSKGVDRVTALQQAVEKVGLAKAAPSNKQGPPKPGQETKQQRVERERQEAAVAKNAKAQNQQPPPMGLGAQPTGPAKVDVSKMSDEQYSDWSKQQSDEKRRERGDFV